MQGPDTGLPVELLVAAFACLPLRDRIAVTHVCRAWRKIALDAPASLWAQIDWSSSSRSADVLEARLARAGSAPVDLRVHIHWHSYEPAIGVIRRYFHQLSTFDLTAGHDTRKMNEDIRALLVDTPAPQLRNLIISAQIHLNEHLFANDAPNLSFIRFEKVDCSGLKGKYPQVSTLNIDHHYSNIYVTLDMVLRNFPEVTELEVRGILSETGPQAPAALPKRLEALVLRTDFCSDDFAGSMPDNVLSVIHHQSIQEVEFSLDGAPADHGSVFPTEREQRLLDGLHGIPLQLFYQTLGRKTCVDYSRYSDDLPSYPDEIIVLDRCGCKRVFAVDHTRLCERFLSTLSSLTIGEGDLLRWHYQAGRSGVFHLTNLVELKVFLYDDTEDHARDDAWDTLFVAPPTIFGAVLDAPRMHRLYLSSDGETSVSVGPEMICHLLRQHLGRSDECPLPVLTLCDVHIVENCVDDIARLTCLVEEFGFEPESLEWEDDVSHRCDDPDIDFS